MKRLLCRLFGHRFNVTGITGHYKWCGRCRHRADVPQSEVIGPDGLYDYAREMKQAYAKRDDGMEVVNKALAEKTGLDYETIYYLPREYATIMAVLGLKVEEYNSER